MDQHLLIRRDLITFITIAICIILVLTVAYTLDVKFHFIDNLSNLLYNSILK